MLATGNFSRKALMFLTTGMLGAITGCAPSGPRALVQGDELLREGKPAQAIETLTSATRLMPEEPRAWNLLGLAYHRSGQPAFAAQAYRQALAKDRSNHVAIAHFNLGCLLLEQNNPAAAADELKSFTLTTNSVAGLVKLATAQLRLRQLDAAERSFAVALRSDSKNVEALNGLGVIHAQKNQRDAAQYFSSALDSNPKFAPALLNAGLLAHQSPATRSTALQRFHDYLAVAPQSSHAESVKLLVRQLEVELASRPVAPSNTVANALLKTNALVAVLQSSNSMSLTGAPPRATLTATNARLPVVAARTNAPPRPVITNPVAATTNTPAAPPNVPVTVVVVSNPPTPKVALAEAFLVAKPATPSPSVAISPDIAEPPVVSPRADEKKKPGFFARLNPFRGKPKTSPTNVEPRVVVLNASTNGTVVPSKPVFSRYAYLSPAPPRPGDRASAEQAMAMALKAQRAGDTNRALLDSQAATFADPSYFEAQYNTALFALQTGDLSRALAGCEVALAIQPDSINARYNFALALKQANFAVDAAREFQKIVDVTPNEPRAHLALGNLYAQQLNDPQKARAHYVKLLELEPRNSQASAIRFWLAANP
jgi:tetratricopeptide (TPR) repeat protein